MATNYTTGPQRQTVFYRGPADVIDIVEVIINTLPSRIDFPVRVPLAQADPETVAAIADTNATQIEAVIAEPNVVGLTVTDDLRPDGVLDLGADVYVASDDGTGQRIVHVPYDDIFKPDFRSEIQPTIDDLNAIAAL